MVTPSPQGTSKSNIAYSTQTAYAGACLLVLVRMLRARKINWTRTKRSGKPPLPARHWQAEVCSPLAVSCAVELTVIATYHQFP